MSLPARAVWEGNKSSVFSTALHIAMNEYKKFHPKENQLDHQIDQYANTNAYQFNEASLFFQI